MELKPKTIPPEEALSFGRECQKDIEARTHSLLSGTGGVRLLSASSGLLMLLNHARQIVFASKAMLDFLEAPDLESVIGKRPGEAIGCLNCSAGTDGCGTGEACGRCGAMAAILESAENGASSSGECHISRDAGHGFESLSLRVNVNPLEIAGETYSVLSAIDIGGEKRRAFLEGCFLHEIRNSAANILSIGGLLKDGAESGGSDPEVYEILVEAAQSLVSEIDSQRILTEAEKGELRLSPVSFSSLQFIQKLANTWSRHPISLNKVILASEDSDDFHIYDDPLVIEKVLDNLIKNALEASKRGQQVTVTCKISDDKSKAIFKIHNQCTIDRDSQFRVFQRFFSTKDASRGMGAYMSRILVERYLNGHVSFSSSEEKGTEFIVEIPLRRQPELEDVPST